MRVRRPHFSLQVWLGAATVAVGLVASLVVVLVVLPTLESSLRNDRAVRLSQDVSKQLANARRDLQAAGSPAEFERLVQALAFNIGGQARAELPPFQSRPVNNVVLESQRDELVRRLPPFSETREVRIVETEDRGRFVIAATRLDVPLRADGSVDVAVPVRITEGQLNIVRNRLIIAIAVVLVLASFLGLFLARLLGRRISRLARTASDLARGDLSARAPNVGPVELRTLGASLNQMAGRLETLVGEITHDRDRAEGLVASLAEGVLVVGPDGEVTVANRAAQRHLDLPRGSAPIPPGAVPPEIMDKVREVAERGPRATASLATAVGGVELQVEVAALAEAAAGVVVTLRDVTEERRLARARRDLVANVSHELKTPLSAIKGFQELLEDAHMDPARREQFLSLMSQEIDRLERLVADQLELARLDAGEFPLEREEFDLGDLVTGVAEPRAVLAAREGVALSVHRPREGALIVSADPARIEQIMLILLDNALRHTPSGGRIRVSVEYRAAGAAVAVADDGEGISDDVQPFVFDRFYQGDSSRVGRSAGLGLAIARGLAEAHGGRIELTSMVGVGSTFTLILPGVVTSDEDEAAGVHHTTPY
ncbi:MAG: ATP-binding protein [Thermoleophilia bacterium]|nr:ATP-binding protein [Thermoleophilia bacterium]